jgi:hypothetical protein
MKNYKNQNDFPIYTFNDFNFKWDESVKFITVEDGGNLMALAVINPADNFVISLSVVYPKNGWGKILIKKIKKELGNFYLLPTKNSFDFYKKVGGKYDGEYFRF